jgi:hypothetical protein
MGDDYARVLQTMAEKYDHSKDQTFSAAVQDVFRVKFDSDKNNATENGAASRALNNDKRNRATASKLKQFYTPRALRHVLEYLAIDYVTLGLRE